MVTPIHWRLVLPLIYGLRAELVVHANLARKLFSQIKPLAFQTATHYALRRISRDNVETSWSDAQVTTAGDIKPYTFTVKEGLMIERRQMLVEVPPVSVYRAYTGLGGDRGWLYMDWAWEIRCWLGERVGGVGLRRGRRSHDKCEWGGSLGLGRVGAIEPGRRMCVRR